MKQLQMPIIEEEHSSWPTLSIQEAKKIVVEGIHLERMARLKQGIAGVV